MQNMKIIRFTAFLMLFGLLALVFACKKETNPAAASQTVSKILVTGQDAGNGLKTTLTDFVTSWVITTDQVGIYSPQARTATGGGGSEIVNAQFTAVSSAAASTFSGTMYWGAASTSHTFYAYYPYTAGSAVSTVVPVSLASSQTQSVANSTAHIGALDFMVATPVTVTSPSNTDAVANEVNLKYNHVFTVLEFQIKGSGTLKAVKLVGTSNSVAFSGGTIDITQTTPTPDVAYSMASLTGTTTQAVVTLTTGATLTGTNADTKVYMVINPGTQTGNCLIGLSADGTTWNYISKAAPDGGFLRGTKYVVALDKASATATPLVDGEGNVYNTVTIGDQTWMAANLNTTKYTDGTAIPNVNTGWGELGTGAYCDYNNTASNSTTYGRLYNWYAVDNNTATKVASNGGKKICPVGWHVPSGDEWVIFKTYLEDNNYGYNGTTSYIAKSMASTYGWTTNGIPGNVGNDQSSNNRSGFSALPGGFVYDSGEQLTFVNVGKFGGWWSSTTQPDEPGSAWYRSMNYDDNTGGWSNMDMHSGLSVRCLKDL